jgi:ATP-binding cassette subfamily F protein 3
MMDVTKAYGGRPILQQLRFEIATDARIGVIGRNGTGKTTLLRLMAGLEEADAGSITRQRGARVALLPQSVAGDERTPLETVLAVRSDLEEIERELEDVTSQIGASTDDLDRMARALKRQEELMAEFAAAGGHGFEGRVHALLREVGLHEDDLTRSTLSLSGGQRKLVGLVACLARRPDLLLLDEPESHLDAERRTLIERLMEDYAGAVVMVSHDRYMLDDCVNEIAELEGGRVRIWPGNYSAYVLARELELQRQEQAYVTQQKQIARLEEAVRRFEQWARQTPNERHIKQARVKQRQIDRMEPVERPVLERRKIALELRPRVRGGERVVELRRVSVAFDAETILGQVDLAIMHGERVGVVGANGTGKTVLVRVVAGDLAPTSGERWVGPSIQIGYLPQDAELQHPDRSLIEIVRYEQPCSESDAVRLLGRFLFTYEQARRPARLLSGGEKTRLGLLLLMVSGANFLVMDEPTNHLDLESIEQLEAALDRFGGTAVFVSHDRYILDRMSDRIVEVGNATVASYEGGWSHWYERSHHEPAELEY